MYKVLDLFCGAGGAAMGLHRAWSDAVIIGIDIVNQPRYPFHFVKADAMRPPFDLAEFDFIWASPPCQFYSVSLNAHPTLRGNHPDLVEAVRRLLDSSGKPYVIENVLGAPLKNAITLCGHAFGLKVYRHRLFESNQLLMMPPHLEHPAKAIEVGRPVKEGDYMTVAGHFSGAEYAKKAMGIHWMGSKKELAQSIPPAYSEYIARQIRL